MSRHSCAPGILLALAALSTPVARAETLACTEISSLPATIAASGIYCLKQDLASAASGNLISVVASNVTIDCNGHKIGGLSAGIAANNTAIRGNGVDNVVVRNCTIRGFRIGISFDGAGHAIEGNRIEASRGYGIRIDGVHSTIRDNRIYDTGFHDASMNPYAIIAYGPNYIIDNTIDTVMAAPGTNASVTGIYLAEGTGGAIAGNRVRSVYGDGGGLSYGIVAPYNDGMSIRDNTVVTVDGHQGIACDADTIAAGNHVSGFLAPVTGCIDGGGNLTP